VYTGNAWARARLAEYRRRDGLPDVPPRLHRGLPRPLRRRHVRVGCPPPTYSKAVHTQARGVPLATQTHLLLEMR